MEIILIAAGIMVFLALAFGLVLGWANVKFRVHQDPRVEAVLEALPGANCGGCGLVGCADYAKAVVAEEIGPDKCPVGGSACAQEIADILGIEVDESAPYRPVIFCAANRDKRLGLADYRGEPTCFAANVIGGVQGCTYGCLGLGDCAKVCNYDAVEVVNGLSRIDYAKCIGCGACERSCPRHIISMIPFKTERMLVVACSNKDVGKLVKGVCKVGCIGCKLCTKLMDVFEVSENVARLNYDTYTVDSDFSEPLNKCPMEGMIFVGKPTPEDLAAVADREVPDRLVDEFKTTADEADWRG